MTTGTLESVIEKKACDLIAKHLGVVGSKLKIDGDNGYPDRIFWLPGGRVVLIEFKAPGGSPRPKQLKIHETLRDLGFRVEVCDNELDAFETIIEALDTPRLSKKSRGILVKARLRCAILRSGTR